MMLLAPFIRSFQQNPSIFFMQMVVMLIAIVLLFLLLFTLRDIMQRTHSFRYQCACVILVGALPILGFMVYLLVRPSRTLKEREMETMLNTLMAAHVKPDSSPAV